MTYAYFLIAFLYFLECCKEFRKGKLNTITLLLGVTYIGIGCSYDPLATILVNLYTSFDVIHIAKVITQPYVYWL